MKINSIIREGKMMNKAFKWTSIFVLVAALINTSTLQATEKKAPEAIKFGACYSITGKFAGFYSIMGEWDKVLNQVMNEKGGVYVKEYNKKLPIVVKWYDDKSDPATSIKFYERLATVDKVDFFIGPTASPQGMAASNVAEKYKIPMIMTTANDPKIYDRGLKYIASVLDLGPAWSTWYFDMLKASTDAKTIALLTEDTIWPLGVRQGAIPAISERGFKLVYDKLAPADTKDFTSVIVELRNLNPDVLYVSAFAPFLSTFIKQLYTQNLKPKALHGTAGVGTGFRIAVGKEGTHGITGDSFWVPGLKNEGFAEFDEIVNRSKIDPMEWGFGPFTNFAAHQILRQAIEIAGTLDREKVYNVIKTQHLKYLGGDWYRKPTGAGTHNPYPVQNIDGKLIPVWPKEIAPKPFLYPFPWK